MLYLLSRNDNRGKYLKMINTEVTIALIVIEILLLAGFLGIIIVISRFSTQIKDNVENLFETLTGDIRELRKELRSYKDEIDALQKAQKENNKESLNKN